MKQPIAIPTFNRPLYLKQVLQSVKDQLELDREVYVFLDGPRNKKEKPFVDYCADLARDYIPNSQLKLIRQRENLGVAAHVKYIREIVYNDYDSFIYHEDDVVPNQFYFRQVDRLHEFFANDPTIGMVASFSANETRKLGASLEEQRRNKEKIIFLDHTVSHCMSKRVYEKCLDVMNEYFDIVNQASHYKQRDHEKIRNWMWSKGLSKNILTTSQDAALMVAFLVHGFIKCSTYPICARYIGQIGDNGNPQSFASYGWSSFEVFDEEIFAWEWNQESFDKVAARFKDKYANGVD